MTPIDDSLVTPILAKTTEDGPWPNDEKVFYVLGANGLFLCRNHEFFESCVQAPRFPPELERQDEFLRVNYPKPPAKMIEELVGFFDLVWRRHGGEAGAVLAWNRDRREVEVIIPSQIATVSRRVVGGPHPVGLHYTLDVPLPAHMTIFCDIHSHCHLAAYASVTDRADEIFRAGLHAVVGRLDREPPEFHVEAVVDGVRFRVDSGAVFSGYSTRRSDFPTEWMDRVQAQEWSYGGTTTSGAGFYTGRSAGYASFSDSWRDDDARGDSPSDRTHGGNQGEA